MKDMSHYKWELGTYFNTKDDFKEAIQTYSVQCGRALRFLKNDKQRVKVVCKEGCQWEAYCGKLPNEETWQLRKLVDIHSCSREYNVKMMSTKWLSKRLQNSLKSNPKLKLKDIKEKAQKKWNVGVNKTKAIRARFAARDMVDGSFLGDYTRIYDYCHEVLRTNPGSTVKLNVTPVQENVEDKRPYFKRTTSKCDSVLNNMSEAFNSVIVESRSKPLVTMLEEIRGYIMEKWAKNRLRFPQLSDGDVLPNIKKKVEKTSSFTNNWIVRMSSEFIFEVRHIEHQGDIFGVNLKDHDCSCRKWQLTGIPCVHALSAMKSRSLAFDDYIPEIYKKARYISVYEPIIYPVNGTNLWVRTEYPDVQPPKFKKMPGRPKKKRNREQGEIDGSDRKMRKTGMVLRCTRCRQTGHNNSTCKMTPPTQASQPRAQPTPTQASQPRAQPTPTQANQPRAQPTPTQTSQPSATQKSSTSATQKTQPKSSTSATQKTQPALSVTRPQKLPYKKPRQTSVTMPPASKGPTTRLSASQNAVGPTTRRTTPTKRNNAKKSI
ncbi:uncharacterized protein LOC131597588 [Vicia villosa]|uniref:uncharacterized protein LOC131597588 n=1 Tax=Vicia villosa TaxID=3911 RepID=UPI00273BEA34|nr:uncharacterized protein LOC131597588 [Vicia villosa]